MHSKKINSTRCAYHKNCQRVILLNKGHYHIEQNEQAMANKPSRTIEEQIDLLESRGMNIRDRQFVADWLQRVSYFRLKGYWWEMQDDPVNHHFRKGWYFEDIVERYSFDKELKIILFHAIETLEIALRTKLIYHMSQSHGGLWYLNPSLAADASLHKQQLEHLQDEFAKSGENFVKEYLVKHPNQLKPSLKGYQSDEDPDAWIIMEVATFGELSKIYKNIDHQLPAKSAIANDFGLNLHSELSSWLEAIAYLRNMVAHHSRLWSRNMVKRPATITKARNAWLHQPLNPVVEKRPFYLISALLYLCDAVGEGDRLRYDIHRLIRRYRHLPLHRMGFFSNWQSHPIWHLSFCQRLHLYWKK